MPNENYIEGANFERRVKNWLHDWGFPVVIRSAGSKGPADLVCVHNEIAYLIQCTTSMPSKDTVYISSFYQWCMKGGGVPVLAWKDGKGKPIHFSRVRGHTMSLPWYEFIERQRGWKHDDFKDD